MYVRMYPYCECSCEKVHFWSLTEFAFCLHSKASFVRFIMDLKLFENILFTKCVLKKSIFKVCLSAILKN